MNLELSDSRLSGKVNSKTIKTAFGIVEYVDFGQGPAVATINDLWESIGGFPPG